jgi:hypothetical protein
MNWLFILAMSVLPTRQAAVRSPAPRPHEERLPTALLAMATGVAVGVGMLLLSVYFLSAYGVALFFGTPLVIGVLTAFLFNRRYPASEGESQQVVLMTMAILAGVALVTATEGAICLLMAAPLGVVIAAVGAALGRALAGRDAGASGGAWVSVLVLPALGALDAGRDATPLREVRTAVEIDAPPEVVWRNVIAFPPLPEPSELVFRLGIAYPMSAQLTGVGVGALRHCNFSTGAFVEPITHWEPGRRLSFDVVRQPAPMQEWSPWAGITPPHLDGYFTSRRGEFRLIPLAGARTRLEGSTWYDMRLEPAGYWALFGDAIIHRIHQRVLRHIQSLSEEQWPVTAAPRPSTS